MRAYNNYLIFIFFSVIIFSLEYLLIKHMTELQQSSNLSETLGSTVQQQKSEIIPKRLGIMLAFVGGLLVTLVLGIFTWNLLKANESGNEKTQLTQSDINNQLETKPKAIMILIEYKDTVGLVNFVNELRQRKIPGLLHLAPEFVEANCDTVKELLKYNMELMASLGDEPFWDLPYEEQKQIITEMKAKVEACTGEPIKIISSPYMASDMTTLKVADELGIPYVTARGTTDTKASVYQVEGFNTKILSVSNIPKVQFKYGSLCDYSYYERAGQPSDMLAELMRAIEPLTEKEVARYGSAHKVTPVTHTNIGGYLQPWTTMWQNFWDSTKDQVEWVNLDTFMADVDWTLPDWQVPINKNAPYTPEKIRPLVPYEDVEKVLNPCKVEDLSDVSEKTSISKNLESTKSADQASVGNKIVMFHNGKGPMCLEALEFLETVDYPVEQVLDTELEFGDRLNQLRAEFGQSAGVSDSFGYYPIIFIKNRAFSGFSEEIMSEILAEIVEPN